MSSVVASHGKLPPPPTRSSSTIVAEKTSGYHLLKIDGYSLTLGEPNGQYLASCPFTVGGHRWRVHYYPNGMSTSSADFISVCLAIDEPALLKSAPATAQFKFSLVGDEEPWRRRLPPLHLHSTKVLLKKFTCSCPSWGQPAFVEREVLEQSGHLRDDCFTIRCDIVVIQRFREEAVPKMASPPPSVPVPPPDLHRHLAELLFSNKGADVVFEVAGETFPAHRCVLAARSPVFSAELFGPMKEGDGALTGVVHIHDMEPAVFGNLLAFIYTDSLPEPIGKEVEEEDNVYQHLLVAADRYGVERLKLMCEARLCERVSAGTAATILALADQHQCHVLRKACLDILGSAANLKAFVSGEGFDDLYRSSPSIIKDLIVSGSPH
ncbi:unnamed protein product [Urochloa decumbens]|uniref:Uncharacterized protein n=1 Tax=Urochloa decumbens TaxID=240449 RepID=A0ABC8WW89_9POAL